jgi:hypothetical protein
MDNLIPRLHSVTVETNDHDMVTIAPGRHGIRCHVPVSVFTDAREIAIEANVDSEFETTSGLIAIVRRHSPVAVELWALPPAEAAAAIPTSPEASPAE